MICIPIIANNPDDALRDMAEASKVADIIELRLDYIKNPDLKRILEGRTKPLIVTNKTKVIVSYHNFREPSCNLPEIYRKLCQCGENKIKIVTYANDITDNVNI